MKKLLFLYLAVCSLAFSQAVRLDPTPVMTTAGNVPPGAMAPVLAVPGSTVHVCQYPANSASGSPCTNYATTYTDPTEGTACPTNAQLVLAGTTTCVSTTDAQGNYGFWVDPGPIYTYTVTIPQGTTFGPYDFTPIVQGTSGSIIYNEGSTGAVNRTVTNRLQDTLSVKDFGATGNGTTDDTAAIQAALNAVCAINVQPNKGGELFFPPGTYKITSTIGPTSACEGVDIHGPSNSEINGIGVHISWAGAANGTVWSNYGLCWSKIHDLHIDGNGTAGVGFLVYADTVAPVVRSSQKNDFFHIYVKGIQGSPGYCVQVGRPGHGDDVSQSVYHLMSLDFCNVGIYQDGSQTVENLFEFNTFGSTIATYGMEFLGGDIHLMDNVFIGGGPATKIANIYVGPLVLRADLNRNYYEDLGPLDPTVFSNYLFANGANPNRPFPTKIDSDRVEWKLLGGKSMDYEQAGPLTVINQTADDIFAPNDPNQYYVNSATGGPVVFADFIGGWYASPSAVVSIGNSVVAHTNTQSIQMMANVFEGRDASITNGSATLTIGASHSFTSTMVGYVCYVQSYLAGNTAQQNAITAFTDANHVTLASAATNTASSLYYRCGRLVDVGQASTLIADTQNFASSVVEGQTPQFQLRRFLFGTAWQNWAWHVNSSGAHLSLMSTDNPVTASYSPFISMIPTSGGAPSSVTLEVPARIGSSTYQKMGVFFQDFTGISPGSIPANSSFTTSLSLTVDTVTPGADWCQVFQGTYTAGIISTCIIQTGNKAQMSLYNVTGSAIDPGTNTYRVIVTKFSYTGP